MKILIADDAVAQSSGLRGFFAADQKGKTGKRSAKAQAKKGRAKKSSPSPEYQVVVSSAPAKKAKARGQMATCDCSNIDLSNQPEQLSAILDALGISLLNRGCNDEGGRLIEQALAIRRKAFGPDHPLTAASLNSFARVLRERGAYQDAEAAINDALRINRAVFGNRSLPVAINLTELGAIDIYQSRFREAQSAAVEGLMILEALKLTATDRNTTRLMDIRARAERALGDIDAAEKTFTDLLALDRMQLGTTQHPKYATHLANFAAVKIARKDFTAAEKYLRQAIDLYLNTLHRPCHPNLIDAYANLGSLLRRRAASQADLKEAVALAGMVVTMDSKIRGDTHELVGNDHANHGRALYALGDTRGAIASFNQALNIYGKNAKRGRFDAQHAFIAEALTWKGRVLVETDKVPAAVQAEPLLEQATAIWPAHLGADSLGEGISTAGLGWALYLQRKDLPRAVQLLERGYLIILRDLGEDNPLTQRVKRWLQEAGGEPGKKSAK